ncbi:redoxin domain-containing protein [Hymenobacter cheonanensis]|uniref:redoxin domain-containing protein n=1 Tax=Hymenobacter sp. CA2-7 TaxID=3063993 RepID=UPI0027131416|nr:redoxin domain-containing protein [Hymenobacter sp. CA2-7]MDO7884250.1 redoxin domain-containing protein [Hymenobacter sp. CA2-7]
MKNYFVSLFFLAPSLALAQPQVPVTYSYRIKGKIGQFNAPAKVYLITQQSTDSATLRQGRFELSGTTAFPQSATLVLERQGRLQSGWQEKMMGGQMRRMYVESPDRIRLFLESGPVTITGKDSLRTAHLTGGSLTADYQDLAERTKPVVAKLKMGASQAQFNALNQEYAQTELAFVRAHPTSWVSLEALQYARQISPPQYAEVAPLYAALTPAQRASPPGQQYAELLAGLKATAIGAQAPLFTQRTPSGQQVSLADYRGKFVLLDFWASWCVPCRAENPAVLKAYETFKGRNFEVLGVSLDAEKSREEWVKAIADDHMPWTQVSDLHGFDSAVAQQYGVKSIPQNFLIDPSGKIVASNLRAEELMTTLAKFIK